LAELLVVKEGDNGKEGRGKEGRKTVPLKLILV
jgi:hypothetical protein